MNPVTVGFGVLGIGYGLFMAVARITRPQMLKKLRPMQDRWGPRAGSAIHWIGYTILPIVLGVVTVLSGLAGGSLL